MRRDQVNRYTGLSKRSVDSFVDREPSTNPCIATVVNHLDPDYMGALEVQIQNKSSSGNVTGDDTTYYTARYLSPFYGVSPLAGTEANPGHQYTQKSYGMWFVPPDIGSKVLVIFAEGGEVFWIGCIPEKDTNFQTPAGDVSTTYNKENSNQKLPVAEINKKLLSDADLSKPDATAIEKFVNIDYAQNLIVRGLEKDETRGLTTSSARREAPSKVFGISTPGPYDRRPEAPKESYGNGSVYHNRLGGSSIVLDDGDETLFRKGDASTSPSEYADRKQDETDGDVTIPHNEMLRLKTRTGHQILLHNSEDLIYIGNSKGTAWVELTSNGKIDIFSEDSISIRTGQDFNFKADRDINFQADRDFNIKAKRDITLENENNFQLVSNENSKITTKNGQLDINTKGNNNLTSGANTEIKTQGDHIESTGGKIKMNGPQATEAETAVVLTTWSIKGAGSDTIMRRVPAKEPWLYHENLDPLLCTPTETDIKKPDARGQGIESQPPIESEYKMTADTFRKGA